MTVSVARGPHPRVPSPPRPPCAGSPPGPIDNCDILSSDGKHLLAGLQDRRNFELVPEPAALLLYKWFGGVPIPRPVVQNMHSHAEVEVYPLTLQVRARCTAARWTRLTPPAQIRSGEGPAQLLTIRCAACAPQQATPALTLLPLLQPHRLCPRAARARAGNAQGAARHPRVARAGL